MLSKYLTTAFLIALSSGTLLKAQYVKEGEFGKTYYDSTHAKVCEIFHNDLRYVIRKDSVRNQKELKEILIIKNGPYLSYYENGKLESSGFYIENEKDSIWLHYSPAGKLIKTSKYKNDIQIE